MKTFGTALALATFLLLVVALGMTGASLIGALETALNPAGISYELNLDPSDNLIISDFGAGEIWQVNPATDVYTIYHGASGAADARVDSAGNVWWTDINQNVVGRYSIADDTVTEWPIENAQFLFGLAIDDSDRVWISDTFDPALFRIDLGSTQICSFTINIRSDYMLYEGGNLWLGGWFNNRILRLDTTTNSYQRWQLPYTSSFPGGMIMDETGKLWWADNGLDALASLDPQTNLLTTYELPTGYTNPQMIAYGSTGLWFSERGSKTIGRFSPSAATGVTVTLSVTPPSTATPICSPLDPGSTSASSTTTGTAIWSGVTLNDAYDAGGWRIYDLPANGDPWGIVTLANTTYVVDQGRQMLLAVEVQPEPPSITLIKDPTNDDGGNALPDDFDLTVGGVVVTSGEPYTIVAGIPYAIDETILPGYEFVSITGPAECPSNLGGSITLASGENITCTITNDDIAPTITLVKNVINDDGGDAAPDDFGISVGGVVVSSGVPLTVSANTAYTIDESQLDGYQFVSISGDAKCPTSLGGQVTLDEGEDITCTITNDDIAPTVTLIKNVINDDGGNAGPNDFGISVGGVVVDSGVPHPIMANTSYAIDENLVDGYQFISISGDAKCPAVLGGTVVADEGEDITCTITNDDVAPTITLIKEVINDDGGTAEPNDFNLTVGGVVVSSGVPYTVSANLAYAINETVLPGYEFVSITGDAKCPTVLGGELTLDLDESITCTITNDDLPEGEDYFIFLPSLIKP